MRGSNYSQNVQYSQQAYSAVGPSEYTQVYSSGVAPQTRSSVTYQTIQSNQMPVQYGYEQSYSGVQAGGYDDTVKRSGKAGGVTASVSVVPPGALTDPENAKAVAKRLLEQYDRTRKGKIDVNDSLSMVQDTYKLLQTQANINIEYSKSYQRVLDTNADNQCTLEDLENLCLKYLCGIEIKQQQQGEKVKRNKKTYTPEVEAKLNVARRLFKKYDKDAGGFLDGSEIIDLIKDTYKEMGMANFAPSQSDVQIWLQMADLNKDNQVSLEEYEDLVIKSLVKAGFKIENAAIVF